MLTGIPLYFLLLFIATLIVALAMTKGVVSFLTEEPGTTRGRVLRVAAPIITLLILVSPWFDPATPFVILFLGLVPMLFYTTLLWWLDHWEREPWHLIAAGFLWGAVPATVLVIVSEGTAADWLSTTVFFSDLSKWEVAAVIAAPLVEESCKGLALLLLFLFFRQHIDTLMDGLVYGAAVGFGFAAVENIHYFRMASFWGGPVALLEIALLRAFVFGLGHGYLTAMTGLGFALGRFSKSRLARITFPLLGLILAMLVHGAHNLLCIWEHWFETAILWNVGIDAFWIVGAIVLIVTSLFVQGAWIRRYLQEEVRRGVLTPEQAIAASSIWRSWTACGLTRRFYQHCAKLALLDHMYARVNERGQLSANIEALRKRVARLSRRLIES